MTTQPSLLPEPPGRYAQVAVAAPVEEPFTYRVPEILADLVLPGSRVRVRFGGRVVPGVVVATHDRLPDGLVGEIVRDVEDCLDREPALPANLLALCERVAREHLVGWGEVLQLALPGLGQPGTAGRVRLTAGSADAGRDGRPVLEALRRLGAAERPVRLAEAARQVRVGTPIGRILELQARGLVELEDEWSGELAGATRSLVRAAAASRGQACSATARAPAQRRVLETLRELGGAAPAADLLRAARASAATLTALERKGLIERTRTVPAPAGGWSLGAGGAGTFILTGAQEEALAALLAAVRTAAQRPLLLHGVTGSGKTEVYLRAAAEAIAGGRGAILLVPEIGLTPQLEERARAVLGDAVAVLHSGQSSGERLRAWWRLRTGAAKAAVGPRSAVFAPLVDVGLIVVDEEQDGAYKQEERPRYNGRDVALWRAAIEGAAVVLGSATPAVETYHRARRHEGALLQMPARVARRPLPAVDVVDMRQEWRSNGRSLLSSRLEAQIAQRLARREQALVLLNRRGFAAALVCRACGDRAECPECSVSLTYHRRERALRCHYCDHREPMPAVCGQCGSDALHDLGFGTERLQAALEQSFPAARIGRFDADETRRRGAHARILSSFGAGQIDVLVGTQMLAKGHDFPSVTLVGVVGADAALGMPDFRAAERTFQLLTQMAGRAGRGDVAGEVLLQAHEPDHYAIRAATGHDYEGFFEQEIEYRRRLRYPPFAALAVCVCRGKLLAVVKEEADHLAAAIRRVGAGALTVLGPATPPIARLRGRFRMQLLLKASRRAELTLALSETMRDLRARRQAPRDLVIDIDPRNLM